MPDVRLTLSYMCAGKSSSEVFFVFQIRYSQQHVEPALLYEPLSLFLFSPDKQQVGAVLPAKFKLPFWLVQPFTLPLPTVQPTSNNPPATTLVQLSFLLQTFFDKFMIMKSQFPHQAVRFTSRILLHHDSCSNDQNDEQLKGVKVPKRAEVEWKSIMSFWWYFQCFTWCGKVWVVSAQFISVQLCKGLKYTVHWHYIWVQLPLPFADLRHLFVFSGTAVLNAKSDVSELYCFPVVAVTFMLTYELRQLPYVMKAACQSHRASGDVMSSSLDFLLFALSVLPQWLLLLTLLSCSLPLMAPETHHSLRSKDFYWEDGFTCVLI